MYKIKYLVWYEDGDRYTQHEYTYLNMISDLEAAIAIAKSVVDQYISCSDGYTTFELSDRHFGAYQEDRFMMTANGIRVWVE